ncbi:hypothetical protein [Streptomyces sp. SM12]|uniref:hypothetical protein n=1 Tax=Streptomyces sp. SM12 TaxID=1071602 RepID=UPI000CD5541A|nr:hypothetical protein [Streptomyces sp. SM12]
MANLSSWGEHAKTNAEFAASRTSQNASEEQTDAIGEGLAAIAYALLDLSTAIREHTEAQM